MKRNISATEFSFFFLLAFFRIGFVSLTYIFRNEYHHTSPISYPFSCSKKRKEAKDEEHERRSATRRDFCRSYVFAEAAGRYLADSPEAEERFFG